MSGMSNVSGEDPATLFSLVDKLGEGSYGEVYTALRRSSGAVVAIKVVPVDADLSEFAREIDILKRCDSGYIVRYLGSWLKDGDLWIAMEYCGAGSVSDLMAVCSITFTEEEIAEVMAATLKGLEYLHSLRIIHRDLKAGNILLTEGGQSKLADFGVSATLSSTMSRRRTVIGTPYWMPPEVIQESSYDVRADIWSLGITAIELADGEPPYADIHPMRAIFMIPSREPPTVRSPGDWTPEFLDFIKTCLRKDFTKRPTASQLLAHPFVAEAAARLDANGGVSPLLEELVSKCLPLIQQARREDNDADAVAAAAAPARPEGVGKPAALGATMKGTMRKAAPGAAPAVKDGLLVKKPSLRETIRRAGGDATGTMMVSGTMRAVVNGQHGGEEEEDEGASAASGTFVYVESGPDTAENEAAADAADAAAVPLYMQHVAPRAAPSAPPGMSGPAPSTSSKFADASGTMRRVVAGGASAAVPAPSPVAAPLLPPVPVADHDMYSQDLAFLRGLSVDDLEDRLYDLDSQFRRDMAALTEKYDGARSAMESVLAEKESA